MLLLCFLNTLFVLTLISSTSGQDYEDYEDAPRPQPARSVFKPSYSGSANEVNRPTPVPILKQINRHNEDGSYTYGYEAADGTFKIETKLPTGEVKGKYGYVDDEGKVRVVEYGANKHGFAPQGEGITVPPPTLVNNNQREEEEYELEQRKPIPELRPRKVKVDRPIFEPYSPPQQFEPVQGGFEPAETAPRRPPPVPQFARPAPLDEAEEDRDSFGPAIPTKARPAFASSFAAPARPRPQPAPTSFAPRPVAAPSSYAPRPSGAGGRSGGILDQLSKDYALPQDGAAPLHDISFGYYK